MTDPLTIVIDTPNYVVRTAEEGDNFGNWCTWMNDPATMRMLNAVPQQLTPDDYTRYVRAHNRTNQHLLGIFRRTDNQLVGLWSVYVDWPGSEFLVNLIVGDAPERKTHVRHETAWRVNRYFFETLGLRFQRANTLATNIPAIRALEEKSWVHTARGMAPAADGQGKVEVLQYSRTYEVWKSLTPMSDEDLAR
jgi:RimJ/RimL family protein N-acetyltransferase